MTSIFLEQPITIAVGGGILAIILFAFWFATQMNGILYAALGVTVLTVVLVLIERAIVTDFESVRDTIEEIALAAENNDAEQLYGYIHDKAPELKATVDRAIKTYQIDAVNVRSNLKLNFYENSDPRKVQAKFGVVLIGNQGGSQGRAPLAMTVTFLSDDGKWKVSAVDYKIGL